MKEKLSRPKKNLSKTMIIPLILSGKFWVFCPTFFKNAQKTL